MSATPSGAMEVLRRGLRDSPELRAGFVHTVVLAFFGAAGSLLVPVLVQQVFDRGFRGPGGFRPGLVYGMCAVAVVLIGAIYLAQRAALRRVVHSSEAALKTLRVRTFAHIHRLSIAEQTSERRGAFVSRVTSDVDALSEFTEWGAINWITGSAMMLCAMTAMFVYSWRLALVAVLVVAPLALALRFLQRGLLASYEVVRTRVGETLTEISESVMGAAVVRAYAIEERMDRRLNDAIDRQYDAQLYANRYMAVIFPTSDLFGGLAMAAVVGLGAYFGPDWGLTSGRLIAMAFLVNLFVQPLGEMSESFNQTQTAIAGWRKILGVLDIPIELVEPSPGKELRPGPLAVSAHDVHFAYRGDGRPVLRGVDLDIPAGAHVAIVGETGCGKTTFAKLLGRLADPDRGSIAIAGTDLREVAAASRRTRIRMVPQDGFLFDTTIEANVAAGRPGATRAQIRAAFESLHLDAWLDRLPDGLDTVVGERGGNLSVGEAQLVALARAQIADPGLLILDEATSAVDPETERVLSEALTALSEGRTMLTIAHRLSTAESADLVVVFDAGRVVEMGGHSDLAGRGGVYAGLYASWLGNTRAQRR